MKEIKYPVPAPHSLPAEEVASDLSTDLHHGLAQEESERRNESLGLNSYKFQKQKSVWLIVWEQFKNPIVYLLVFGSVVSFYFGDLTEGFAIIAVIFLNALIGFFMEIQARRSMHALRAMDVVYAKVIRNGSVQEIPSEQVAPGDLISFEAGDLISADGRLVEANQLQCDESSLTGESLPADKKNKILSKETSASDQHNMVFKGTSVVKGNGKAIVTGIGLNTQIGQVTSLVESSGESATPLDKKLNKLTQKLIYITVIITLFFIVTGFIQKKEFVLIIETSIALAVAAIPEGLPIVATIALASGMLLMAKKNAIVKKLTSVETLGGTNIILTDKTGTLTENKIYVNSFSFPNEKAEAIEENNRLKLSPAITVTGTLNYEWLVCIGLHCNNASIQGKGSELKEVGDPIEIALLHLAERSEVSLKNYPRIAEEPFNSDTKIMGTLHEYEGKKLCAAKGSVEQLLEHCEAILADGQEKTLTAEQKSQIIRESEQMSAQGLRVLAFAYRVSDKMDKENFMQKLCYAGMIGFLDPPRLDVRDAILSCRQAGIKVVMITGDHPKTAVNIAEKTGLVNPGEAIALTGSDLPSDGVYSEEMKKRILMTTVFARATPKQKLDIAEIYQEQGNIVAMTGDGVNDAPALKKADVGIAMGLRGTQVAKETADIILKNDSFVSIAEAVAHGREIFQNIQKFVIYLISCNLSEIFVVTILGFAYPEATLLPLQILFLNMVTDVFPALALGMGKGDHLTMKHPPRDPKLDILTSHDWKWICVYAFTLTFTSGGAVFYCNAYISSDPVICNNVGFLTLALAQLWHVMNMSSGKTFRINNEITRNIYVWAALFLCFAIVSTFVFLEPLREVLSLVPLSFSVWMLCTAASILPVFIIQTIRKIV